MRDGHRTAKAEDFGFYARLDAAAQAAEFERIRTTGKFDHPLERMVRIDPDKIDKEKRTATFPASSEEPVQEWWGFEVLSHTKKAIRIERLNAAAPLLVNHDPDQHIGVVEKAWIEGNRLWVRVRFSKNKQAEDIWQDVLDGIRPNVSIGYRIYQVKDITVKGDPAPTLVAIDWEPFEVTSGSIPADYKQSGLGRTLDLITPQAQGAPSMLTPEKYAELLAVRGTRTLTADEQAAVTAYETHQRTLANPVPAPAPAAPAPAAPAAAQLDTRTIQDVTNQGIVAERTRTATLRNMAETHGQGIQGLDKVLNQFIAEGRTAGEFGQKLLELRTAPTAMPAAAGAPGYKPEDLAGYSILRALRTLSAGEKLTGLEAEVEQEHVRLGQEKKHSRSVIVPLAQVIHARQRTMNTNSGAAGGFLVQTENQGLIELLRNSAVLPKLGVTMLEGLQGDVTFPRQTGAGTAYWVGQSVDPTASDQTLGNLLLTPKTVGAYTRVTRKLLKQSSPSAEAMVQNDLLKVIGLAIDAAAINGSGVSGKPLGLLNISGIGSVSGTSLGWAGILEFESDVASANAEAEGMKYLSTPAVRALLKARTQVSGGTTPPFIWTPENTINGRQALASNQVPSATMIYGDWAQLILAMWGSLELRTLDQGPGALSGDLDIVGLQDVDVALKQTGAISVASSIS